MMARPRHYYRRHAYDVGYRLIRRRCAVFDWSVDGVRGDYYAFRYHDGSNVQWPVTDAAIAKMSIGCFMILGFLCRDGFITTV